MPDNRNIVSKYDSVKDEVDTGLEKLSRAKGRVEELKDSLKELGFKTEKALEFAIKDWQKSYEEFEQIAADALLNAEDILEGIENG